MPNSNIDKVRAITDHARQLVQWSTQPLSNPSIPFPDPELCFRSLPLPRDDVSSPELLALQDIGVQLWNACCGSSRDVEDDERRKLIAKARVFAFFVLESASNNASLRPVSESSGGRSQSLATCASRNAVRAAKECLAHGLLDLASKIIEHLAKAQDKLRQDCSEDEEQRYRTDFLLLRITHAWRSGRLDLAEHFHTILNATDTEAKTAWLGSAADLYYEIGASALEASKADLAVLWLRHALDALDKMDQDAAQIDFADLQLNASHCLIRALLATDEPEAGVEALTLLDTLKKVNGHRLPVMLLEVEMLSKDPTPNAEAYCAAIGKIARSVHIIDQNHSIIMYYIHCLKPISLIHALRALKNYITQRLISEDNRERTESAIVTLIWMAASDSESTDTVATLSEDLDAISQSWVQALGADAAHAVALIVWKSVERLHEEKDATAAMWCQIGLHPMMSRVGKANKAKLQRKLISHLIDTGSLDKASHLYAELSTVAHKDVLNSYLGYLLAIKLQDENAADIALGPIIAASHVDPQLLLACVGETIKSGSRKRGALLMQRVLDQFNYNLPANVDTCALLRCTARLHLSVLKEDTHRDQEHIFMLCGIFRAAAVHIASRNGLEDDALSPACPFDECAWFEKMSFNIALENAEHWPTRAVVDLLTHSSAIAYPGEISDDQRVRQKRHRLNAAFLQAIVLVRQARSWESVNTIEDIPRTSYQSRNPPDVTKLQTHLYQNVLMRYQQLRFAMSRGPEARWTKDEEDELNSKAAALLPLAFEAQLHVALTDILSGLAFPTLALTHLIDDTPNLTDSSRPYSMLADLLLSSAMSSNSMPHGPSSSIRMPTRLPAQHAISLLGRLITAMRRLDDAYDIVKAARWIRCVVQLVLDARAQHNEDASRDEMLELIGPIVAEAVDLARSSVLSMTKPPVPYDDPDMDLDSPALDTQIYPTDELQWLSTVLFNLAVDMYVAENGEDAQAWAKRAVDVADALRLVEDAGDNGTTSGTGSGAGSGGRLVKLLRDKGRQVGWEL